MCIHIIKRNTGWKQDWNAKKKCENFWVFLKAPIVTGGALVTRILLKNSCLFTSELRITTKLKKKILEFSVILWTWEIIKSYD